VPLRTPHWNNPGRAFFECQDGRWVLVAGVNEGHWQGLLRAGPRGSDRRPALPARPSSAAATATCSPRSCKSSGSDGGEWVHIAGQGGVCDVAQHLDDIINDPQAQGGFFTDQVAGGDVPRAGTAVPVQPHAAGRAVWPRIGEHERSAEQARL
jgi:crotonobetainyl-CoA:carnitine CoA-transferase CaiB-like acyl-CoA transferase